VQVRGSYISVDMNGKPLFTSVKAAEGATFGGLLGVYAKVSTQLWYCQLVSSKYIKFTYI